MNLAQTLRFDAEMASMMPHCIKLALWIKDAPEVCKFGSSARARNSGILIITELRLCKMFGLRKRRAMFAECLNAR